MFTNNYFEMLRGVHSYKSASLRNMVGSDKSFGTSNIANLIYFGKSGTGVSPYVGVCIKEAPSANNYLSGVCFGSGNTPPTIDDYALSGDYFTTFTATASVTVDKSDDETSITALYTLTNTGSDDFTISEIGLAGSGAASAGNHYLFDRTLLDTPVTIPSGGVGQVTYTLRFKMPTA